MHMEDTMNVVDANDFIENYIPGQVSNQHVIQRIAHLTGRNLPSRGNIENLFVMLFI